MKKIYVFFLFLISAPYICRSQQTDGDGDKVESIKVAYITKELNLSPDEAKNFWPVYSNYVNEVKKARGQYPDDEIAFEQKVVEIRKNYQGNFQKVLGNDKQRVNKMFVSDKNFRDKLRGEQVKRIQNKRPVPQQSIPRQMPNKKPGGIKRKPPGH